MSSNWSVVWIAIDGTLRVWCRASSVEKLMKFLLARHNCIKREDKLLAFCNIINDAPDLYEKVGEEDEEEMTMINTCLTG